ncbi:MAG: ATP-grasp fold amidoligase family protein [Novosphingobium sp.]
MTARLLSLARPLRWPSWARWRVSAIYFCRHGYLPNLTRPQRFNEWVQWRKLEDRDVTLAALTDKAYTKALAAEMIGPALVVPTLWMGDRLPGSPPWPLPFIVKANHGCGQFVVVRSQQDWRLATRLAPRWLDTVYGRWLDEWHYGRAERALLVEPFIGPEHGLPTDYKVFVFGGKARFVQVHLDRATNHRWIQFDRLWNKVSRSSETIAEPSHLAEMLQAAERIARGRDHLRVDFYEVDGRLWFGEACLFPGSGLNRFDPVWLDEAFGRFWAESAGGPGGTW